MRVLWRDVVGYEGLYQVSDLGRIRSLDHTDSMGKNQRGKVLSSSGRARAVVNLSNRGAAKVHRVCRLVLEAFVGPCPDGMEACHAPDRNSNALENLRWDTHENNASDMVSHGTSAAGERNPNVKLTAKEVRQIKRRVRMGELPRKVSEDYDTTARNVRRIRNGETWQNL